MNKILVDEQLFDDLLDKALPKEYEINHKDDSLEGDELLYFLIITSILNDTIDKSIQWLSLSDLNRLVFDVGDFDSGVFEGLDMSIKKMFDEHFSEVVDILYSNYNNGNVIAHNELNIKQQLKTTDKISFNIIKWHNYNLVTNLNNQLLNIIKQTIFNGINKGLDIYAIQLLLLNIKNSKIGNFSQEHRAKLISKTEITTSKNTGYLQGCVNYNISLFDIITAGDSKVCSECLSIASNNPYSIEEVVNLIPNHPLCRCLAVISQSNTTFDENYNNTYVVNLTNY